MAGSGADGEDDGAWSRQLLAVVAARRDMGGGMVFLTVRELEEAPAAGRALQLPPKAEQKSASDVPGALQLLCPPQHWRRPGEAPEAQGRRHAILNLLRPGTAASFCLGESGSDLVASTAEVLRVGAEPSVVTRVAEAAAGPRPHITLAEAGAALGCAAAEAEELARLWEACGFGPGGAAAGGEEEGQGDRGADEALRSHRREFRAEVLARCRALRGLPAAKQGRQRGPHLHRRDLEVLEVAEASFHGAWRPVELPAPALGEDEARIVAAEEAAEAGEPPGGGACVLGAAHPSFNLLEPERKSRRGPMLMREYAHGKKGPQISWFLARLREMMPELCAAGGGDDAQLEGPRPPVHFLDVGGGRGDLGICVASAFPGRCHVTVVDQNERSLAQGRDRAAALGLGNVDWMCCGVSDLRPEELSNVDVVLGLHTCGGLADAILALAAQLQALRRAEAAALGAVGPGRPRPPVAFLICPCCFHKNAELAPAESWRAALGQGPAADTLTRLAESDDRGVSLRAMGLINSARLETVQTAYGGVGEAAGESAGGMDFRLLAFPPELSARNLVLQAAPSESAASGPPPPPPQP